MGKVGSPQFAYCEKEDFSHTFFACGSFAGNRRALAFTVGVVASDIIVKVMLSSKAGWRAVASYGANYFVGSEKMDECVPSSCPV